MKKPFNPLPLQPAMVQAIINPKAKPVDRKDVAAAIERFKSSAGNHA